MEHVKRVVVVFVFVCLVFFLVAAANTDNLLSPKGVNFEGLSFYIHFFISISFLV